MFFKGYNLVNNPCTLYYTKAPGTQIVLTGSIFIISEAPETQMKQFLWLVQSVTDIINMVEGTGSHFDPSNTAIMCFRRHKGENHWPECLFLF